MIFDKNIFYDWGGANDWLFQQINSVHGEPFDSIMVTISHFSESRHFPEYLAGLAIWAVLSYLVKLAAKRGGAKQHLISWFGVFAVLIVGFVVSIVTINAMKDYYAYPRPYLQHAMNEIHVMDYKPGDEHKSFPSGHVAFATLMVVGLWPVIAEGAGWLCILALLLVCWSRIALGAHFPADVLYSVLIVMILVMIVRSIIYGLLRKMFDMRC